MKKNLQLVLISLTVLTILIIPVSAANKIVFKAKGEVLSYYSPGASSGGVPGAVVHGGDWDIAIRNVQMRSVDFKLHYYEMNLSPTENAPYGSIDQFWITPLKITNVYFVAGDGWHIEGSFNVDKLAVQPDGSKRMIHNFLGDQVGGVIIRPSGMLQMEAGLWNLVGTTT